jgi:hypothetical protein
VHRSAGRRQSFEPGNPPTHIVFGVAFLIIMEAAITWLVLFSPGAPPRWRRALLGVVLTSPAAFLAFVMIPFDSPAYEMTHAVWLVELSLIAAITLAISAVGALISRLRTKAM